MKKTWQAPRILVQEFETNEYVAACYSLYCAISGDGEGNVLYKSRKFNWTQKWDGQIVEPDYKDHGQPCANGSSYNVKDFFENSKPASLVDSVHLGSPAGVNKWYATWSSTDGGAAATGRYNHYGYAVLDDANRPNHS